MKIIKPIAITEGMLVDTNIPECASIPTEWVAGTYALDDLVYVVSTHSVYQSLYDGNTESPLLADGTKWQRIRSTDRWLPFDGVIGGLPIEALNYVEYQIQPGELFKGIALLNIYGVSVDIIVTDATAGEVYNKTISLVSIASPDSDNQVIDWYTYFFSELFLDTEAIFLDLPPFVNGVITIRVNADPSENASIGEIVIGRVLSLGVTQKNPQFSITDYSVKEVNPFGGYNIVQRPFSKRIDVHTIVLNNLVPSVIKTLTSLRTTPVVWVPTSITPYQSALVIYGYYRDFSMVIPHSTWADMNLQIEGLT